MKKKVVVIEFTKVDLPYGWLGNMFASPVKYDGKIWRTSEALFQALRFEKEEIRELIRSQKSPMAAKMKAKGANKEMVIEPMSDADIENMRLVLKLKFDQNLVLKSKLKITGEHILVENIGIRSKPRDLFWGMKKVNGEWIGENKLGQLLMDLRVSYLMEEKSGS